MLRFKTAAFLAVALTCCFNVTSPNGPPPKVDPPLVACTLPPKDAGCEASTPDDASDNDAIAPIALGCDAAPPTQYWDECKLPPSVCADSHWAAYFDDGSCVAGTCQLVTKYHYCQTGCSYGGCISNGPTAANRGF